MEQAHVGSDGLSVSDCTIALEVVISEENYNRLFWTRFCITFRLEAAHFVKLSKASRMCLDFANLSD